MAGPEGSIAIHLGRSGKLIIAPGGVLSVRGDTVYWAGPEYHFDALIVKGGGTWKFDGSQSPRGTKYSFHPDNGIAARIVRLEGTAAARAVLTSDTGGANGYFSLKGGPGGAFVFSYGEVSHIGDATTPAISIGYEFSGNHLAVWDVSDTRFISCGTIQSVTSVGVEETGTFRHIHNVHEATLSPGIFSGWINIAAKKSGAREIRNNVFDVSMTRTQFYPNGFIISGNYFADATQTGPGAWISFQGNFLRYTDWWPPPPQLRLCSGI